MESQIKVLIVEDVATDAELICMELEFEDISFSHIRVETKQAFITALSTFIPDVILSDYSLPGFSALEALKIRNDLNSAIPFILVTGNQTEEIAVECIKKGADDYILKSSLTRLPSAVRNVLEKKKAEQATIRAIEEIKAREEKYRNLFENSLVGMFRSNLNTCKFLEANQKTQSILGVDAVAGMHFDDFGFCNETGSLVEKIVQEGSIENYEILITKPDGSKVWVSVSAKVYQNEGIIEGVIQDISSLKSSYEEMEKANYELDRFAYHASHDLRSPLRSFEGLIQAALEEDNLDDIRTFLKMMQKSVSKMDALISDLLSIAHSKKAEAKITSIDFDLEVKSCLAQLSFMENFKSIHIFTSIQQQCTFFSDAVRLRIILNNLISNAIKYHRLQQLDPSIWIDIAISDNAAVFQIKDNGSGIDQKDISKIFDMFYRASNDSDGSGLGLYLVKMTIEKLNGEIKIDSQKGIGTTFYISIPNMQ